MFVDASALVGILLDEPGHDLLADTIDDAMLRLTSPLVIFETTTALMRAKRFDRHVAEEKLRAFMSEAGIEVVPMTDEIGRLALDAFDLYGKGRGHKAQLNMGDCFAYACAKAHGVPLLYKGNDFKHTDLA